MESWDLNPESLVPGSKIPAPTVDGHQKGGHLTAAYWLADQRPYNPRFPPQNRWSFKKKKKTGLCW